MIRPEATATRTAKLESVVEFLDPVFDVAPGTVDPLVDEARRLAQLVTRAMGRVVGRVEINRDPPRARPRRRRRCRSMTRIASSCAMR